ncbi:MAG: class I SAM-dependent methyltransferase [Pirellulaceae bacterium]|nr:class I SAM-dependent methyltransferase [Pirellulaceae bacterium]
MEFGVHKGATLNWLAQWCRSRAVPRVFGFDSFAGLPHEWKRTKSGPKYQAGHFALEGLPCVQDNAVLIPGFFDASLEPWLAEHPGPIAFLHNDSDLYSSTALTLRLLNDRIVRGTVIVFDELCDWGQRSVYDAWEEGEWKALREWMAEFDREISVISRDQGFAAAVAVTR